MTPRWRQTGGIPEQLGGSNSGRLFQAELFHRGYAHLEFLDLAVDGHRERVHELPVQRDLVLVDLALAPRRQLIAGGRVPVAKLHLGHDPRTVCSRWHFEYPATRDR